MSYTKHNQSKGSEEKSKRCGTLQRARMVGTGAEDTAEDGLGAAHRLRFLPHRPRRERPLQRQGMLVPAKAVRREAGAKQGGNTVRFASSLMRDHQDGFFLCFRGRRGGNGRTHYTDQASEQTLRRRGKRSPRPGGHQPGYPIRGDFRRDRPERRGKKHPGAVHQPAGAAHRGRGDRGRPGYDPPDGEGAAPGPEIHRHDFPEL